MNNSLCVLLLSLSTTTVISKELPNYIPICKRSSPAFNMCIKMASVVVQPYIAQGIKELNIPPIEPLEIPMVKLEQGTPAVNYKATLTNIKIYGLSKYKFTTFMSDFNNGGHNLFGKVDLPRIHLVADYVIQGRALVVPIQGNGQFTANITNCKAEVVLHGELLKKKGNDHLHSKDTKIHLTFGGAMANFENLFNGDETLSRTTNNFLNENAKDLLEEVKPAIEAVAGMLIDDIANKIFRSLPFDKLFPK